MMTIVAIIPARMDSTRFPGKPLADILGLPMIEHVRRRVAMCSALSDAIVATCDQEIIDTIESFGGKAVMTASSHERCTDRIAEAARNIEADIVVNIQGDEPLFNPEMILDLIEPFYREHNLNCTNLMSEISDWDEFKSRDVVKTVCTPKGNALYFSREPIPSKSCSNQTEFKGYKQLGVIAFRSGFLQKFNSLSPTPLEEAESVDMLRVLEHGYSVRMVPTRHCMIGVDTPDDLDRVVKIMRNDELTKSYLKK